MVLRGVIAAASVVQPYALAFSEILLALAFAAVLAVVFEPLFGILQQHRVDPTVAAGLIVLGLLAVMTSVFVATVRGVTDQAHEISEMTDEALDRGEAT